MRSMSWVRVVVGVVVAGLSVLCVGCAAPSRASDADELRDEVAGLAGVESARLKYSEPVPLDSGKLVVKVTMSGDASDEEIAGVVETAYDAFRTTHHDEEADLAVRAGQTTVAVRSFQPEASVAAVDGAVRAGLAAAPEDGSVAIDLTTQDVSRGDHVAGTYVVALADGSTYSDVPDLLASLSADQPENKLFGWGGAAADGSSLSYDSGFPPAELVGRWERLQAAGLPLAVRAFEDGTLFAEGRLTERYDVNDPADRRALDRITHPQLRALGEGDWMYDLRGPRGGYVASIDRYICVSTSEGPYDDALEAWVLRKLGPCEAAG